MKKRISVSTTFRVVDCDEDVITALDRYRTRKRMTRLQALRVLSGNPLKNREDVKTLQNTVKKSGYRSIEYWLADMLGIKKEFVYGKEKTN